MKTSDSTDLIELELLPASNALQSNDRRWQGQVAQLLGDLKRNAGEVRKEIAPVPGRKGGLETLILALGSSGALTAAVAVFKTWLARSNDRSLRVKGKFKGQEFDLEISGHNVEEKTVQLVTGLLK